MDLCSFLREKAARPKAQDVEKVGRRRMLPAPSAKEFRTEQHTANRQSGWDAETKQGRWCTHHMLLVAVAVAIANAAVWHTTGISRHWHCTKAKPEN